jgi:hypothetical protein
MQTSEPHETGAAISGALAGRMGAAGSTAGALTVVADQSEALLVIGQRVYPRADGSDEAEAIAEQRRQRRGAASHLSEHIHPRHAPRARGEHAPRRAEWARDAEQAQERRQAAGPATAEDDARRVPRERRADEQVRAADRAPARGREQGGAKPVHRRTRGADGSQPHKASFLCRVCFFLFDGVKSHSFMLSCGHVHRRVARSTWFWLDTMRI